MQRLTRGQSLLEYVILLVIIIAALISMQIYMKRGMQGRWKESVDQLGDQYDAEKMNSVITYTSHSNSESRLQTVQGVISNGETGYYTMRSDSSTANEAKNGSVQIGHF